MPTIILACIICLLLTPLVRNLAVRLGWFDQPDFHRKLHRIPVPRLGGIPVVLAYFGSFGALLALEPNGFLEQAVIWKFLPASLVVFATGLLDDLVGLRPSHKLAGQLLGAVLACQGGVRFSGFAGYELEYGWSVLLTVVWLAACTNAFNLIDGVDGVAAGLGVIAALSMLGAAALEGHRGLVLATALLAGVLIGFLRFNFNPATIFLGDSGSLWIGFVLACGAVEWSRNAVTLPAAIAPFAALSIPLFDTGLSVARRFATARPVFGADHGHIHHRLIDRGYTPRRVALVLYGVGVLTACSSLLLTVSSKSLGIVAVPLFFLAAVWIAVRCLGYQEFGILLRLLQNLRPAARSQLLLHSYEKILQSAATPEACWQALRRLGLEFGFSHVALRLGNGYFEERLSPHRPDEWNLYLPLSASEYLSLTRGSDLSVEDGIAPLASLQHALSSRAVAFRMSPEAEQRPVAVRAGAASIRPARPSLLRSAAPPSG